MKSLFTIFYLLSIAFYSCNFKGDESGSTIENISVWEYTLQFTDSNSITVQMDTIDFSVNGFLWQIIKCEDKFYCTFYSLPNDSGEIDKRFCVLNSEGKYLNNIKLSKRDDEMFQYYLFEDNDSLFTKRSQGIDSTFLFETNTQIFEETNDRDSKLYTDSLYNIYAVSKGEFGGSIFFQNIENKDVYEAFSINAISISKLNHIYYVGSYDGIIDNSRILLIDDPKSLKKSHLDFSTRNRNRYDQGVELLLDTVDSDFELLTTFIVKDKLYILYSNSLKTFIGKIESNTFHTVASFDFKFSVLSNQYLSEDKQLLSFIIFHSTDNDLRNSNIKEKGFLIIDNGNFHFKFFKPQTAANIK